MGVVFAKFADEDRIISIAKNSERNLVATDETTNEENVTDADLPAGAVDTSAVNGALPHADSGKVETPNE
jgi:DNA gyrase subunit A